MTDPASYRGGRKRESPEKKLVRSVINSPLFKNLLRKVPLIVLILLFGATTKLKDAVAESFLTVYSESPKDYFSPPEWDIDVASVPDAHGDQVTGKVLVNCNEATGWCVVSVNLAYSFNGMTLVGTQSGSWTNAQNTFSPPAWINPGPGVYPQIYAKISVTDGAAWDTVGAYIAGQNITEDVPEIPAGAAIPLAFLLGAGIFCLRRQFRTS